jgi:hypothetical protein
MRGEEQVRMTQARRLNVDKHFATGWRGDIDLVEIKPAAQRVQDECFHVATL